MVRGIWHYGAMIQAREVALEAALRIWLAERDPNNPQPANIRRILSLADRIDQWLTTPGATSLVFQLGPLRPINAPGG